MTPRKPGPLEVSCPTCRQRPRDRCITAVGKWRHPHKGRVKAAERGEK